MQPNQVSMTEKVTNHQPQRLTLCEVWCDVGGTFTDCFLVCPDQPLRCIKVLSTGVVKGRVARWRDSNTFIDPDRIPAPDGFWSNSLLRWLDRDGNVFATESCFDSRYIDGQIQLEVQSHTNWIAASKLPFSQPGF
jgi:5-oxoprolinase (ATP-hydrolysing)